MSIDKDTKYDRQLRLWEASGQNKLENSHICLINATTTGSELLKNLVLPGIGEFSIIEDGIVTETSLSGNFFLNYEDIGKLLSEAMTQKLLELNSDVKGNAINDTISNILQLNEDFWDKFSVVVVSEFISISSLETLKTVLWHKKIPLLIVSTIGFYGAIRLVVPETTVIETHDPSKLFDLRIDKPFPKLKQYADSIDLDAIDDTDHAHVPYVVIFLKALENWRNDHDGILPRNYPEKKDFKFNYVEKLSRNINLETNFIEASQSVHRALQITQIPSSILNLFQSPKIEDNNLTSATPIFWVYVKALKNFVHLNNNQLPLPGNLPDMASDTSNYITLLNIYHAKASEDLANFTNEVYKLLPLVSLTPGDINHESIKVFCKNTATLYVSNGSKNIFDAGQLNSLLEEKTSETDNENNNILAVYFGMLTYNIFVDRKGRIPTIEDFDSFTNTFVEAFTPHLLVGNIPHSVLTTFREILNHNSTSYHNISSLIGGISSQEILKIVTSQYIPLDNLLVFDGIRSLSEKWKIA